MRNSEEDAEFRRRTGRLDKWREAAKAASSQSKADLEIPDKIEQLGFLMNSFHVFFVLYF